jgi:hypothetical protein
VERADEFLPWHWNRPQLGHCRRTPRGADVQRGAHVLPLQQPMQQADGERITGTCRVYLICGNGINMHLAGGSVRIRTLPSARHHDPLKALTRYGAHGLEDPGRRGIVELGL